MKTDVRTLPHGGQLHRIAELFGIPVSGLLDFSANINPEGPSKLALEALCEALKDPSTLSQYPDLEETKLRRSVSSYAGVALDEIAVANGFVPLLDATLRALSIRSCLIPVPAFSEYRSTVERAGMIVTPIVLDQAADFRYQPEKLLATLKSKGHDCILLANPQNPSGVLCDRATLREFVEESAKLNVNVFLDEAFIDYAPDHSLVKDVNRFPNLVVFRSITKFHGMPGIRVAYVVAQSATSSVVRHNLSPWPIATLAAIAVRATLADGAYAERTRKLNQERREDLVARLDTLGLGTYPAAANFMLIKFQSIAKAEHLWERLILEHGIVLRHCTNFEGLSHDHLRCAILGEEENSRLIRALTSTLER